MCPVSAPFCGSKRELSVEQFRELVGTLHQRNGQPLAPSPLAARVPFASRPSPHPEHLFVVSPDVDVLWTGSVARDLRLRTEESIKKCPLVLCCRAEAGARALKAFNQQTPEAVSSSA
jgi:hypothetical protein